MNSLKLALSLIFSLIVLNFVVAQEQRFSDEVSYDIIPLPQRVSVDASQQFILDAKTIICYSTESEKKLASTLADYIKNAVGLELQISDKSQTKNTITLKNTLQHESQEAYIITVDKSNIEINGSGLAGVFYGIQTLRKSLPVGSSKTSVVFQGVKIEDSPRFSYRGMMLDVSRHFSSVDFVKKYIDLLALHNVNKFHLHLTEDQGWRIEIKKYPKLNEIGSHRKETVCDFITGDYDGTPHGGYYTQEELRDIVRYAQDRYIEIIPEVDLPGHMLAALASYPELGCTGGPYEVSTRWGIFADVLCAGNENVYQFLEDVLSEVIDIFPSKYIHIGGDECLKNRWRECFKCQQKIKKLGLKSDDESTAESKLQSNLTARIEKFLNSKGRKIIGWDEIIDGGLAPNAIVMSWRGEKGGIHAAKHGHDVIMVPNSHLYFDYYQTENTYTEPLAYPDVNSTSEVYSYEPIPTALNKEEQTKIWGVQANLWVEMISKPEHVEYMTLPRLAALSEVQWSLPERKNYADFINRLQYFTKLYLSLGYNFSRAAFEPTAIIKDNVEDENIELRLLAPDNCPIFYTTDGTTPSRKSLRYEKPIIIDSTLQIKARAYRDVEETNSNLYVQSFDIHKGLFKKIELEYNISKYFNASKGKALLLDGRRGNGAHVFGDVTSWVGFGKKMSAIVDLGSSTDISSVVTSVLLHPNTGSAYYKVSLSDDGIEFKLAFDSKFEFKAVTDLKASFEKQNSRFVKVEIEATDGTHILSDEIFVK